MPPEKPPPSSNSLEHALARINKLQDQVDALQSNAGLPPRLSAVTKPSGQMTMQPPMPPAQSAVPVAMGPKLLTEFIGTLFLAFTIGITATTAKETAPLAIGGVVMAMIYAGGHISGAHYNPTVSVAVYCRGKMAFPELVMYILSQLVGAFVGAGIARAFTGPNGFGYPTFAYYGHACLMEFLWGMLLAACVLHTATSSATTNNSYFGLAVGAVYLSGAVLVGPISGGSFNGAVGLALQVVAVDPATCWVYLLCPTLGGAASGLLFHFSSPEDFEEKFKDQKLAKTAAAVLMEFFATTFLGLYLALRPYHGTDPLSPVAFFALAVAITYTCAPASGCHMNPAVSAAVFLRFQLGTSQATKRHFPLHHLILYVLAQLLGALVAAGIGATVMYTDIARPIGFPMPPNPTRYGQVTALFAETLGTFALAYVFCNVCTVKTAEGNSYFGIAIAFTYTSMSMAVGGVSGGCLNPALAMLTCIRAAWPASFSFAPLWIYFCACPIGAMLGALTFRFQNVDEYDEHLSHTHHVAKRYSAMTSGHEHETQYSSMMRSNIAGHAVKRASCHAHGAVAAGSIVEIPSASGAVRPSARAPASVTKVSASAIETVEP